MSQKYKFKNIIPRNKRKLREQRGEDLDAEADDLAERLQRAMADEDEEEASGEAVEEDKFCNVSFDDWLKLAIRVRVIFRWSFQRVTKRDAQYAFALTMNGEYGEADECLRHICTSAVCKEPENRLQAMWFALAICAYHAGEGDAAMFELRQVLKANDFSDEVLRTMQAMFTSGHAAMVGWSGVNHQKFVLRTVKMFDKAANVGVGGSAKINKKNSRQASPDEDEDDDDAYGAFQCTKVDPYFLVQYSNVLLACRSYSSAICTSQ